MPVWAIVIKKADGGTLVKFKQYPSRKKLRAGVIKKLEGTKHKLKNINYVMEDMVVDDRPFYNNYKNY